MVSVKRLSLQTAQRIAQATIDACREKGIQIGVTVVDRDGVVQAQLPPGAFALRKVTDPSAIPDFTAAVDLDPVASRHHPLPYFF